MRYGFEDFETSKYNILDKSRLSSDIIRQVLNMTAQMFEYSGLPETITTREIELLLQVHGSATIIEKGGLLYAVRAGLGGEPNAYYMPTIANVSNPALNITREFVIDTECIVIPNDYMYMGLMPILQKYATLITENTITLYRQTVNKRTLYHISASDDNGYKAAENYLSDVEAGKAGVIADNAFLENVKIHPISSTQGYSVIDTMELQQYLISRMLVEIGINSNHNMKREALNSAETNLNEEQLLPLVDNMLECRKIGVDKINKMYGTNITVNKGSVWAENSARAENNGGAEDVKNTNSD